jgi:hypothetical protein
MTLLDTPISVRPLLQVPLSDVAELFFLVEVSVFWSLVMVEAYDYPNSPDEEAFLQLLISETAFAEISLAIGLRQWSLDVTYQAKAAALSCRAINTLVERIKSGAAHSDAGVVAVVSMAIEERLMHNEATWHVHVDGLANLIDQRRLQGESHAPSMLCDFLLASVLAFLVFVHC